MEALRGTGVAVVTPFENYKIDFKGLTRVIEHVIEGGVDYIVCLGSTGENMTLDANEKRHVIDHTIDVVSSRVPIVAGNFGGSDTRKICNYIDNFDFKAVDAILSSSPAYNKPSQEGIYQHYKEIAAHSPVPIIMYNVPGRTCSNMEAETTLRLAHEVPGIAGIKEAAADMTQASHIIRDRPEGFLVISGDDPTALPLVRMGGDGVISVIANALPAEFSEMIRKGIDDSTTTSGSRSALNIHHKLLDIHPLLYVEGNPTGIKAAMEALGICSREVRLPLTPMSEANSTKLRERLSRITAHARAQ